MDKEIEWMNKIARARCNAHRERLRHLAPTPHCMLAYAPTLSHLCCTLYLLAAFSGHGKNVVVS